MTTSTTTTNNIQNVQKVQNITPAEAMLAKMYFGNSTITIYYTDCEALSKTRGN